MNLWMQLGALLVAIGADLIAYGVVVNNRRQREQHARRLHP